MSNYKLYFWSVLVSAIYSVSFAGVAIDLNTDNKDIVHWMQLMQYQKTGVGFQSKIKALKFFISKTGATDPGSELKVTLELFQKKLPEGNLHPQCIFPARYQILKKAFDLAPPVFCQDYTDWKNKYQLSYVSLFYAGPYLSSPSSVFGHSFLLLGSSTTEEFSQITFNYAADIPNDVGAIDYAYKGLTGGFSGVISILPYYQRLYQYTDMENRDLWEYRLNLNAAQVNLLADYIWEIKNQVQFDYYFLDENCASILLWILKAIKPEIIIETSNSIYISPSEVTQVVARENLVQSVIYHPSLLKRLNSKINFMTSAEKTQFRKILDSNSVSSNENNPVILEAVMDHLNIQRHNLRGELPPNLKPVERTVLLQRSKIQKAALEFNEIETPLSPHTSHLPMRLQTGIAFRNSTASTTFSLRPGVHGLLDYDGGYLPNSSVKIMEFEIQAINNKKLRLQNLTLLNLTNFPSVNFYQNPFSWSVDIQLRQNDFNFESNEILGEAKAAAGYAIGYNSGDLLFYSLISLATRTKQARPLGDFDLGPQVGFIYSFKNFKTDTYAAYLWQYSGQQEPVFTKLNSEVSFRLNQQWSLYSGYSLFQDLNKNFKFEQFKAALEFYF